jgi:hypothetical protein
MVLNGCRIKTTALGEQTGRHPKSKKAPPERGFFVSDRAAPVPRSIRSAMD